jgi:hypothetical protein
MKGSFIQIALDDCLPYRIRPRPAPQVFYEILDRNDQNRSENSEREDPCSRRPAQSIPERRGKNHNHCKAEERAVAKPPLHCVFGFLSGLIGVLVNGYCDPR